MAVHGVGVDVVDVTRLPRLLASDSFVRRWFTPAEAARCRAVATPERSFAALLAEKEAAWKSLRIRWSGGVPWAMVEVLSDGVVTLHGPVLAAAEAVGVSRVEARSFSTAAVALAVAVAWDGASLVRAWPVSPASG